MPGGFERFAQLLENKVPSNQFKDTTTAHMISNKENCAYTKKLIKSNDTMLDGLLNSYFIEDTLNE